MVIKAHHATRHLGYDKRLVRSLLFALCSFRNGDGEDDAMVRDVASYQWATNFAWVRIPTSTPTPYMDWGYCWFSPQASPRGFSPCTPVFLSPQKLTLLKIPIWSERMDTFQRVLENLLVFRRWTNYKKKKNYNYHNNACYAGFALLPEMQLREPLPFLCV